MFIRPSLIGLKILTMCASWKFNVKINNDWTVCYKGKIYQIIPMSKRSPAVKKCTVKETLSGHISITYRDCSFPNILPV